MGKLKEKAKQIRKAVADAQVPSEKPIRDEDWLSLGVTPLNLAVSGRKDHGIAKGMYLWYCGGSESGKAQPLDANVLTPSGWRKMGDIKVGDQVIDPCTGTGIKVVGVFPQGKIRYYEVAFSDGSRAECCGDHLWEVRDNHNAARGTYKVLTTDQIRHKLTKVGPERCRLRVPVTEPVEFATRTPEMPAYLLGVLLGNGYFGKTDIRFSTVEKHILEASLDCLPGGHGFTHIEKGDYYLTGRSQDNVVLAWTRQYGLSMKRSAEKFIPKEFLQAPLECRKSLLRGLMDTDGYVDERGNSVSYSTSSEQLALDVQELVRSLGGIASITSKTPTFTYKGEKKEGQRSYNVWINLPDSVSPFSLPRKLDRYNRGKDRKKIRRIVAVIPKGKTPCQCIRVNSERGLYITDDYVVTHNTMFAMMILAEAANNPSFDKHRLIYDGPEFGAKNLDIADFFGERLAGRIEPPKGTWEEQEPSTLIQEFYYNVHDAVKRGHPFIYVLDSMDSLDEASDEAKFLEEKEAFENNKEITGSYGMGKAKANSNNIKRIVSQLSRTGSILVVISQVRDKVGRLPFPQETVAGGRALRFYADVQLWTKVKGDLTRDVKGKKREYGKLVQVDVQKNRVSGWSGKVTMPFLWQRGFDETGACVDWLVEEGIWPATKGVINASDYGLKLNREKLIAAVEAKDLEGKLASLVQYHWRQLADATRVERKKRYQ